MSAEPTTLVVDDERMVRWLVRRMLEPDLSRVVEADDGETALRLLDEDRDGIDVVLTDVVMPGLAGDELLQLLWTRRPDLPVVCMSGFAGRPLDPRHPEVPFIAKPFTEEALRATLAPLLETARARRARGMREGPRR